MEICPAGMKPRILFTSHSRPPLLCPVMWASTVMPSARSDQSPTSTLAQRCEFVQSIIRIETVDDDIQFIADRRFAGQRVQREHALIAPAQIHKHMIAENP